MNAFGVKPKAMPAWRRLSDALADYDAPCQADPEAWWSMDETTVDAAVMACHGCHVLQRCAEYADAASEPAGVWAGVRRDLPCAAADKAAS